MTLVLNGTTGVSAVDGSAATPAIQGNDTNTGIFFPAADTIAFAEGGAEVARFDSSGNFGVGTSSPESIGGFTMVQAGQTNAGIFQAFDGTTKTAMYSTGGVGYIATRTNHPLAFNSNGSERARIDSSGNLLVGTTSALANVGKIQVGNGTGRAFVTAGSSGDVGTEALRIGKFDNNSTSSQIFIRFTVNNDGAGCGQIVGNGASTAAFSSFSDERLKENIVSLPPQLSNICALRPVEFDYKDGSGHQIGFIAQEMQAVYPDVVSPADDEMLMVTGWSKTEARLVRAIQEQQALIAALQADVAALKGAQA